MITLQLWHLIQAGFCQAKTQWLRPVSDHSNYHDLNRETCKDVSHINVCARILISLKFNRFQVMRGYILSTLLRVCVFRVWPYTLSLLCPCLAMASYLIFPSASTCTARALDVFFFLPISSGNWATWISGKAPPSPKSSRNTDCTGEIKI